MSLNKGKAKAKPSKKTTAKTAGTKKKAVMNRRKYNEAISGDTMSNYAMYKRGGKVKKYQAGKQVAKSDSTAIYAERARQALKNMSPDKPGSEEAYDKARQNQLDYENRKNKTKFKLPTEVGSATYKKGGATKTKKFAALAPPYDKVTFADKIAGAKKRSKKK